MALPANRPDDLSGLLTVDCGTTLTDSLNNMTNVQPNVVTIQLAMTVATMRSSHVGTKTDRQLALLKFSIEAGILLCGNGVSRHVGCTRARTHARLQPTPALLLLLPSSSLPAIRSTRSL